MSTIGPINAFIFKGEMVTIMATKLPFFSEYSETGFLLNVSHQLVIAVVAICGGVGVEIIACLINNTVEFIPELISLNIEELSARLKTGNKNIESQARLRNILMQIRDYDL